MTVGEGEREVAVRAVRDAARLCALVRRAVAPGTRAKSDASPVTVADLGAQALVCRCLAEACPGDPVMAEEDAEFLRSADGAAMLAEVVRFVRQVVPDADTAAVCDWIDRGNLDRTADRFWVLDPIDGTKGFLRGDHYAVALALVERGEVMLGALACPLMPAHPGAPDGDGSLVIALRGRGAASAPLWVNDAPRGVSDIVGGADDERWLPVRVSLVDDFGRFRQCEPVESAHSRQDIAAAVAADLGIVAPPVRLDSQAKYAAVARGDAEVYLRLPTSSARPERIWDHAAGALIVAEAGGTVTDIDGRGLSFDRGTVLAANRGIVASNGSRHGEILSAIARQMDAVPGRGCSPRGRSADRAAGG